MTKNRLKIAFCFSGQARTLDQTYLFFQKNLFDAAKEQGFDYDVFCAVEDDEDVDKVKLLNPTKVEKIKSSEVDKIIEDKYGKNWIEKFSEKYSFMGRPNIFWLYFQQVYKVSRSIIIKDTYQSDNNLDYTIVFKLRFDCFFMNKLNFHAIKSFINDNIIIANETKTKILPKKFRIINDFFFIGTNAGISTLGNMFNDIELGFKGFEVKRRFYTLLKICNHIRNFMYEHLKTKRKRQASPILIWMFESGFYNVCSPELHYLNYFSKNQIDTITENFSYILLAKQTSKSYIRLENKNKYEL